MSSLRLAGLSKKSRSYFGSARSEPCEVMRPPLTIKAFAELQPEAPSLQGKKRWILLALSAHRQFARIGVNRYFFFDTLRLALLRPSYRGRRAGVDSFRFLRFFMVRPHSVVKGRTRSASEGSVISCR